MPEKTAAEISRLNSTTISNKNNEEYERIWLKQKAERERKHKNYVAKHSVSFYESCLKSIKKAETEGLFRIDVFFDEYDSWGLYKEDDQSGYFGFFQGEEILLRFDEILKRVSKRFQSNGYKTRIIQEDFSMSSCIKTHFSLLIRWDK